MKIASNRADARQIGAGWCEYAELREVTGLDQLCRRGCDNKLVVVLAQPFRPRRGAQADDRPPGPSRVREPIIVELEPSMALVDDGKIDVRHLATRECLHTGNLDRGCSITK